MWRMVGRHPLQLELCQRLAVDILFCRYVANIPQHVLMIADELACRLVTRRLRMRARRTVGVRATLRRATQQRVQPTPL
eukprot:5699420-Prymnesium_polylepis.1